MRGGTAISLSNSYLNILHISRAPEHNDQHIYAVNCKGKNKKPLQEQTGKGVSVWAMGVYMLGGGYKSNESE